MKTSTAQTANPRNQLAAFIRKFDPRDQQRIRAVRRALRKRFPTAHELVCDNYNFLGKLIIRSVSAKQRPRRKPGTTAKR